MTSNWETVPLGELITKRSDFTPVVPEEKYEVVGIQRSGWGFVRREAVRGDSMKFSKLMKLEEGDLSYRVITAFEAPSAVVDLDIAGSFVTPQTFPVFKLNQKRIMPPFMALLTTSSAFHSEMADRCTGTVLRRKTLSVGAFREIPIILPPLAEQRRIVDLIGALDDAVEAADEATEQARILLRRLQGQFPSGESFTIGDLLIGIDNGVTTKSSDQAGGLKNQLLVKASAVLPAQFVPSETKPVGDIRLPENARVIDGDLLMTRINTPERVGHICMARDVPPNLFRPDLVWKLRLKDSLISADFFEHLMSSQTYRSLISAAASGTSRSMQQISKGRFALVSIVVPSLTEQAAYSKRCSAARETVVASKDYADSLRILRSEMLTSLFSAGRTIPESYDELLETVDA